MVAGIVYEKEYILHNTWGHVERAERLESIIENIKQNGIWDRLVKIAPVPALLEEVSLVHTPEYIQKVKLFSERGGGSFGGGNIGSERTYQVSLLAVGGALAATRAVMDGKLDKCFALIRPPGHHAKPAHGMGFCFFNNLAVAARFALKEYGLKRILLVDWDAHHGNGIENVFYREAEVLYFSVHRKWSYPGTGWPENAGEGAGAGYNINVPLDKGAGDGDYLRVFEEILVPVARQYRPELVMVAAGQDAYCRDPIGEMGLSECGYGAMAAVVCKIAGEYAGGKLVAALEGGYALGGLARCTTAILNSLLNKENNLYQAEPGPSPGTLETISRVKEILSEYWPEL